MVYAVGGMGLFQACQFGMIVLLAKLTPAEVLGQVQYSLAVATPIILFFSLELRGALLADAAGEFSFATYQRLRYLTGGIAGTILLAFAIWEYAHERNLAYALIFVGMTGAKLVLSFAEVIWGLFQKRERLDLMAASAALRGAALLVAFLALVPAARWLEQRGTISAEQLAFGPAAAIWLYVGASLAILLSFDRRHLHRRKINNAPATWNAIWRLARHTFPLGLVLLMLHLCNSIPPLAIEAEPGGKAALGHFGALATVTIAGNLAIFQAANAAANRISAFYQTDLRAFLRLAGALLGLAALLAGALLAIALPFGQPLLRILFRADYAAYYPEFCIIVGAQCIALFTNVLGVLVTQMRLFWVQVPAQVIILAGTFIAAMWLVPGADNLVRAGAWTVMVRSVIHVTLYTVCVLIGLIWRARLRQRGVTMPPAQQTIPEA